MLRHASSNCLVRGEELTRLRECQALLVAPGCTMLTSDSDMATILLCGVDLFIRGKLEAVLPEHRFETADGVEPPDLVIADIARIDANDVAESYPDVPILGYTNHTDTSGLRRAHSAGFDQVVAKSALFERTRELIDGLLASVE